VNKLAIL